MKTSDKQKAMDEFKSIGVNELLPLLERGPVTLLNESGGKLHGVMSAELVNATEETAWNVLLDYPSYPRFMHAINISKVLSKKENEFVVRFEAGVKVMGVGGTVKYVYHLRVKKPYINIYNKATGNQTGYWAVLPVEGSDHIVLVHSNVSSSIMEMSKILKFVVEKVPSAELGLRISPVVMMVNDMKRQMEKVHSMAQG
ncbi:SRPBCC family protein [bacterium]